ncbi:LacI family DNA-binding transcriptional regulator [Aquimarina algicola]|uniref:LacI family transcriptional regulator n=1 Tax=Aquimarina algicola TaxID=2589995 RepID=A0A504JF15_9FLAO|nr:LacI family DNA-binding transcriptional regulator [Aquimarina algicola]TPN87055.1 LacI family transcriptional regulator [Aquimarina algicola]
MTPNKTTLSTIAKDLNVSVSTVSKALANSPEISSKTRKKISAYAKESNYSPNILASSFRKGSTKTIGLIIPNITNPFYAKVFVGIEKYLDEKGYKLIASISNDYLEKEIKNISIMSSGFVDGLIVCVSKEAEQKKEYRHINSLINNRIPLILFDRVCDEIYCDKVITDNFQAALDATEYLIKHRKCRHIVMTSKTNNLHHLKLRKKGFEQAIDKHKATVKSSIILAEKSNILRQKLENALRDDSSIDGVFGLNEKSVLHATLSINKLKKTDKEVSITGFCNDLQSKYNSSLIVINQNPKEIGKESARLLLDRIKSGNLISDFCTKIIDVDLT